MSTSEAALEFRGVSKLYRTPSSGLLSPGGRFVALDSVSFAVNRGEIFGLVGESGCGKSTLGRIATRLLGADAGEVLVDGRESLSRKDLSSRIQIVFQDPASSLNPKKRVGWILEEPLRVHALGDRESRARAANAMLEKVGLDSSYRDRFPRELSGGQRQRVSIGAALMLEPSVIVADEPVSALDVSVQAQVLNLLLDLREELGLSILFISHNLDVVRYLCDRVAVMFAGRIVELGAAEELYSAPAHPYTRSLLEALPRLGPRSRAPASTAALAARPCRGAVSLREQPPAACPYYARCPIAAARCAQSSPALEALPGGRLARCHYAGCGGGKYVHLL